MYRIELRGGEEAIYKSYDEFAKAVRTGAVGSHARIWHAASSKWLPISFHPHFKKALSEPAAQPAPAAPPVSAAPPAPKPKSPDLEFIEVPAPPQTSGPKAIAGSLFAPPAATPRHIEALVAAADVAPEPHAAPPAEEPHDVLIDIGKPRFSLPSRRTLGIAAAAVVLIGAGTLLATHRAPAAESAVPPDTTAQTMASTSLAATPSTPLVGDTTAASHGDPATSPTMYMPMPVIPAGPAAENTGRRQGDSGSAVLPAAPKLGDLGGDRMATTATGSSVTALANRYAAAHDAAEAALLGKFRAAGMPALFAADRLGTDRVSDTRLAVAGIANFIRGFRQQDAAIEGSYRDSAAQAASRWSSADQKQWQGTMKRGESTPGARAADQLLQDISSLLGVLEEQRGAYTISGGTISFRDAGATLRYGTLRRQVTGGLENADSASVVIRMLRQAIGSGRPPVENYSE